MSDDRLLAVQTFAQVEGGEVFDIPYDVPDPLPTSAALVLAVATMTTGAKTADYDVTAALAEVPFIRAAPATHTTDKRRHRLTMFILPITASSPATIRVRAGRKVNSFAAVIATIANVDPANPILDDASVVGNQAALSAQVELTAEAGAVLAAAQTRRGSSMPTPVGDNLTLVGAVSANPRDANNAEVAVALAYMEPDTAQAAAQVGMSSSQGALTALVAVALRKAAEPEPPEPQPRHEEFVIVRNMPPGSDIVVRVVRPQDIHLVEGGNGLIDWETTKHSSMWLYYQTVEPAAAEGK